MGYYEKAQEAILKAYMRSGRFEYDKTEKNYLITTDGYSLVVIPRNKAIPNLEKLASERRIFVSPKGRHYRELFDRKITPYEKCSLGDPVESRRTKGVKQRPVYNSKGEQFVKNGKVFIDDKFLKKLHLKSPEFYYTEKEHSVLIFDVVEGKKTIKGLICSRHETGV